jgi:hypothetical protein
MTDADEEALYQRLVGEPQQDQAILNASPDDNEDASDDEDDNRADTPDNNDNITDMTFPTGGHVLGTGAVAAPAFAMYEDEVLELEEDVRQQLFDDHQATFTTVPTGDDSDSEELDLASNDNSDSDDSNDSDSSNDAENVQPMLGLDNNDDIDIGVLDAANLEAVRAAFDDVDELNDDEVDAGLAQLLGFEGPLNRVFDVFLWVSLAAILIMAVTLILPQYVGRGMLALLSPTTSSVLSVLGKDHLSAIANDSIQRVVNTIQTSFFGFAMQAGLGYLAFGSILLMYMQVAPPRFNMLIRCWASFAAAFVKVGSSSDLVLGVAQHFQHRHSAPCF